MSARRGGAGKAIRVPSIEGELHRTSAAGAANLRVKPRAGLIETRLGELARGLEFAGVFIEIARGDQSDQLHVEQVAERAFAHVAEDWIERGDGEAEENDQQQEDAERRRRVLREAVPDSVMWSGSAPVCSRARAGFLSDGGCYPDRACAGGR